MSDGKPTRDDVLKVAAGVDWAEEYCRIPDKLQRDIPNELCAVLKGKGLSLRQAELLLDITKALLGKTKV